MKTRRILSTILALTMLLTLFSGEFASAAGMTIVTAGEELAYDPLAETASVAYEQHDAGYAVSLDRAADSVTMHVTAVPGSRSADKARLYVRTGVELKAGVAYRVSFALSSEKKLADYTVNFDGDAAAAYGKLDKRSIDAGATDRVEYTFTPKAASGELVLRLLLGTTEVNTLRFSDLAVEEAPAEQSGANKLLVDKLNYAAPGAIRCAAEAGYSAEMDSTDTSATMTVTNVPKSGAEVWKLKLMVSTGLKPQPGKTYRFRATLNSSNSGSYEACYNEGEVEKGYDVLYNQSLKSGSQTVERMIYVPTDKENPGELIVQFSLGLLSKGTKVTISKVTVEEASPAYTNALARGFALDTTGVHETYDPNDLTVTSSALIGKTLVPGDSTSGEAKIWAEATDSRLTFQGNAATLQFKGGTEVGHSKLHIETYQPLAEGNKYIVTFKIKSQEAYAGNDQSQYNVLYSFEGGTNPYEYGGSYERSLKANTAETISYRFSVDAGKAGNLVLLLELGKTNNQDNVVTVSDIKIEQVTSETVQDETVTTSIAYPTIAGFGKFEPRDRIGAIVGDGNSATITLPEAVDGQKYHKGLFVNDFYTLLNDHTYKVSFDYWADQNVTFRVRLFDNGTNKYSLALVDHIYFDECGASATKQTWTSNTITGKSGNLYMRIDLDDAAKGTKFTISNITITDDETDNVLTGIYPNGDLGSFSVRDHYGSVIGNGTTTITYSSAYVGAGQNGWDRGIFSGDVCWLDPAYDYKLSYAYKRTDGANFNHEVVLNRDTDWDGNNGKFGSKLLWTEDSSNTIEYPIICNQKGSGMNVNENLSRVLTKF